MGMFVIAKGVLGALCIMKIELLFRTNFRPRIERHLLNYIILKSVLIGTVRLLRAKAILNPKI